MLATSSPIYVTLVPHYNISHITLPGEIIKVDFRNPTHNPRDQLDCHESQLMMLNFTAPLLSKIMIVLFVNYRVSQNYNHRQRKIQVQTTLNMRTREPISVVDLHKRKAEI